MYSKFEIFIIFKTITDGEDFNKVCEAFLYLNENGFPQQNDYLHRISDFYYNKIFNT